MPSWGKYAGAAAIAVGVAVSVFVGLFLAGQGLSNAALWASVLSLPTGIVAAGAALWPLAIGRSRIQVPPELEVPDWVVGRPEEAGQAVTALLGRGGRTVGITTGLYGAGGFGKTTLARIVCADPRIRRWFRGGVYLVTVGRDIRGAAAMASKINDVIKLISGEEATFADPEIAGNRLGVLLENGPRRLLVVDDVWDPEQLAPFASFGRRCALLVTTRVPSLLGGRTQAVLVDQMSGEQARQLLMAGLPPLDPAVTGGLLAATGRWPLLLRLVNKILTSAKQSGADVRTAGAQLLARLRTSGPAAVDDLLGEDISSLRVGVPSERARAVRATIEASTSLLSPSDTLRFMELGVFAEDETIPFDLAARLWRMTAGMDELEATRLCGRLTELALVSSSHQGTGVAGVRLHDVVRDFLRGELGQQQLASLNRRLLDGIGMKLSNGTTGGGAPGVSQVTWWEMGSHERYMWDHLIEHLLDADRRAEAEKVASDLRWVGARVSKFGPAAAAADLSLLDPPRPTRLRTVLTRIAHLLAPTEPPELVVDVLHSRLAADPDWGPQVAALQDQCHRPRLVNRWPLPDLPDSALLRVLAGHDGSVDALAVAPDSSWLATGDAGGTVRIWDTSTGRARVTLTGHRGRRVTAIAIAPDSSWLATAGTDGTARIWDPITGHEQIALRGHHKRLTTVVIAPDGRWLATVDDNGFGGKARLWDAVTGNEKATFTGRRGHQITAVAVSPDGRWLATGGTNGKIRVWDTATKRRKRTLSGHRGRVKAVVIAEDGSWLATVDKGTVRTWAASGQLRATLSGYHGEVKAVSIAPDGTWLATVTGGVPRIWDALAGRERAVLRNQPGHQAVAIAIAPDSAWLAVGDDGGRVRICDAATGHERAVFTGHNSAITVMAAAQEGKWLVTGDAGGTVRIWDTWARPPQATSPIRTRTTPTMMAAPDGSWLATSDNSGGVRIWDAATGHERATLANQDERGTATVRIAPDSNWLATTDNQSAVRVWDAATGLERCKITSKSLFRTHLGIGPVVIAPSSAWLAVGDNRQNELLIYNAVTGRQIISIPFAHRYPIADIVIAPDGKWFAVRSGGPIGGTVGIWDAATRTPRGILHTHDVLAITAAPDSSWLATESRRKICIWDAATGKLRVTLARRRRTMHIVTVAGDASLLATIDDRHVIQTWETATGRERTTIPSHREGAVAAVSPDGRWFATIDRSGVVRTWDVIGGRQYGSLPGHHREVAMAVSPDGRWLTTVEGGTIWIWDPVTVQPQAMMRVDSAITSHGWLGVKALAGASRAGLYSFDFKN